MRLILRASILNLGRAGGLAFLPKRQCLVPGHAQALNCVCVIKKLELGIRAVA